MSTPTIDFSKYEQQSAPTIDFSKYETPPAQPGFIARASEQVGLTQHPIDQLIGELQQLKEHPVATTWEAIKQPIIGLRDLTYNLVRHPVDTVQQITGGKQFAQDVQSGNYAGAAGTLAGAAGQVALMRGPQASIKAPAAAETLAGRLYQSALKPGPGSYSTAEVAKMVGTGLENEIPVSADGIGKLSSLVDDLNSKVRAQIQAGSEEGATISPKAVASRTENIRPQFETVNPEASQAAISASKAEYLGKHTYEAPYTKIAPATESGGMMPVGQGVNEIVQDYPAMEAQLEKQKTYTQLRKSYGELSSATKESQKALAKGIKEELQAQFPEIQGLNARESQLLGLDEALQRAVRRIDNHQLLGIGTPLAAGAAGAITASGAGAAAGGILKLVLDNPIVKSKLAIALSKASRGGGLTIGGASARVAGYASALGRATGATQDDGTQVTVGASGSPYVEARSQE